MEVFLQRLSAFALAVVSLPLSTVLGLLGVSVSVFVAYNQWWRGFSPGVFVEPVVLLSRLTLSGRAQFTLGLAIQVSNRGAKAGAIEDVMLKVRRDGKTSAWHPGIVLPELTGKISIDPGDLRLAAGVYVSPHSITRIVWAFVEDEGLVKENGSIMPPSSGSSGPEPGTYEIEVAFRRCGSERWEACNRPLVFKVNPPDDPSEASQTGMIAWVESVTANRKRFIASIAPSR